MNTQGAFAIILNKEKDKVLLVQRKDFPIWDLPGGRLEESETLQDCVIREVYEETGYIINVHRKIGTYNRPQCNDIQHTFFAEIIGGNEIKSGDETRKIKWFPFTGLPLFMVPHRKMQIKDYINGKQNVATTLKDSKLIPKVARLVGKGCK